MSRRDLLRRSAVGAATVGAVSTGAIQLDHGPVQNSQAIAPAIVAGGVGASMAAGWALRELDPLGIDESPADASADQLRSYIHSTARARKSFNQTNLLNNAELAELTTHTAWSESKLKAIEALNEQKSEAEVLEDARQVNDDYYTTRQKNFLRPWNEAIEEFRTLRNVVLESDELDESEVFDAGTNFNNDAYEFDTVLDWESKELLDGTEHTVHVWRETNIGGDPNPRPPYEQSSDNIIAVNPGDYDTIRYLHPEDWKPIWEDILDAHQEVHGGLETWVEGVYSDYQSGDIEVDDLLTPAEQAELTSDDEDFPQAISDLQALNVPVDLEREAEIFFPEPEATAYGQLGYNGDEPLSTGMIDPSEKSDAIYFTYDISQGSGSWSAYDDGVDGGTITLTAEPFAETIYQVHTIAGETAEFHSDDLEDEGSDEWTIDLSDQLEDQITEIESIEYFSDVETTEYETIRLTDEFELIEFTDSDGETYDESNFESSEPQTDDNYITQEEWEEQQERHEELIEQYEDAQGSGISIPGVEDVLDGEANGLIGIAVVGMVLVSAILSALNPLS